MKLEPIVSIVDYQLLSGKKLWPPAIERLIEAGQVLVRNKVEKVSVKDRNLLDARIKTLNDHELLGFDRAVECCISLESINFNLSYDHKLEVEHDIKLVQLSTDLEFRNREKLYSFLSEQNPPLIRAKGNVLLDGQLTFINYVNNELEFDSAAANGEVSFSCFYE